NGGGRWGGRADSAGGAAAMEVVVEGLVHEYAGGVRALDGVSLRVAAGTRLALLGENGAGKSTLVKHWNGLLRATAGRVSVGGDDVQGLGATERARRVGYMFQNPDDQLFGRKVASEVAFGPKRLGVRGAELEGRVAEALEQVGLREWAERHPFDLDLPRRKLLALACVLAMRPAVLVLDEPTSGLDAPAVARVTEVVAGVRGTVAIITHDVDWAAEVAERFVVMDAGRVLADGTAAEVLTKAWPAVDVPSIPFLAAGLGMVAETVRVEAFVEAWRGRRRES
ncbi:MAG: energy-coupling factor ABC transporter ATP-binding protein, partial [Candidatus Xenobia bacterium]